MRLFEYPGYEQHKQEHEQLIQELNDMVHRMHEKGQAISIELLHFLRLWLVKHIQESDKEYTPFFLSQGVKAKSGKKSWFKRLFH